MTLFSDQFNTYQDLRHHQFEQMGEALQRLRDQIAQQLDQLQQQEQVLLEAQTAALGSLRLAIEADARCLLSVPQFRAFIVSLRESQRRSAFRSNRASLITEGLTSWLLATQPLPLEIIGYDQICDEWAYNDENYYTDYRYQITARLGSWQKQVEASTASLHPGDPVRYVLKDLCFQYDNVAYCFLKADHYRPDSASQSEFSELNLDVEQVVQLKQEMGCILTFVGNLFNIHSRVEHFRYPQQMN